MGADKDLLKGKSVNNSGGIGISNEGLIDMGISNDEIIGIGRRDGIFNDGTIDMDDGNDLVDASRGGFAGSGSILLGKGRDTIKGYGKQKVDGGSGRDKSLLGKGSYTIKRSFNRIEGNFLRGFEIRREGEAAIELYDIETIGSIASGETIDLNQAGLLVIDGTGGLNFSALL